jgi:hypothetical protein
MYPLFSFLIPSHSSFQMQKLLHQSTDRSMHSHEILEVYYKSWNRDSFRNGFFRFKLHAYGAYGLELTQEISRPAQQSPNPNLEDLLLEAEPPPSSSPALVPSWSMKPLAAAELLRALV